MLRTLNNMVRTTLFHAFLPPSYWVYAVEASTYLVSILPTKTLGNRIPTHALYLRAPSYNHLCVFGCLCFPNVSSTSPHKLSPHSSPCVFLGYPTNHRGYRCLELSSNKIIFYRHVVFDESTFHFSNLAQFHKSDYEFLQAEEPSRSLPNQIFPIASLTVCWPSYSLSSYHYNLPSVRPNSSSASYRLPSLVRPYDPFT